MSKDCGACGGRHADSDVCFTKSDSTSELVEAVTLVSEFFQGSDVKTAIWFTTENPHLGGVTPIELFKRWRGHKVLAWIKASLEENKV